MLGGMVASIGQTLHEIGQQALTWLPVMFFGLIVYLLWRTVEADAAGQAEGDRAELELVA